MVDLKHYLCLSLKPMNFESWLRAKYPSITTHSAEAVLRLTAEGATVPFMARYRKEQTGNLDEVAIQNVLDSKESWDLLIHRQQFIIGEIDKQNKLTDDLKSQILMTYDSNLLEDLYLPFKQKRKTKSALAKEAGLEPLADWIWNCGHGTEKPQEGQTLDIWAFTFRNEEKGFKDAEGCLAGAQDILVERLSEKQELRQMVRQTLFEKGEVLTKKTDKAKPNSKFESYFSYHEPIDRLLKKENSHRYLAMRRGWMEEELELKFGGAPDSEASSNEDGEAPKSSSKDSPFENEQLRHFEAEACTDHTSIGATILLKAARLSFKAHVLPSIENEIHKALKDIADEVAIQVFAQNVRKLLLASPFGPKSVMGIDPGIRTGCKVAVVNDSGKFVANTVIHLEGEEGKAKAKMLVPEIVKTGEIHAVAIGNGTAGRETEVFIREALKEAGVNIPVVMVSEAGASVYSASEAARDEFPDLDLTVRGAISIARRLQDPLAELVKTDAKSIGVGQYQHDVSQPQLKRSLEHVVDSCVNQVGVNLNTASSYLLSHVSGIGPSLAKTIVEHREKNGIFKSREALNEVPRFTKKVFELAAGFLRVKESANPLDNTGIHPEQYPIIEKLASERKRTIGDLLGDGVAFIKSDENFKKEVGEFTFNDIIEELEKPGRDPREGFVPFSFRDDIHELKDLQPAMVCPGIVTNVTNFGAFVDIGVHQDGLVHISQLSHNFVKDPREVVSPGDRVTIKVLEVNLEKKQISLSMKLDGTAGRAQKGERTNANEKSERPKHGRQNRGDHQANGQANGQQNKPKHGAKHKGEPREKSDSHAAPSTPLKAVAKPQPSGAPSPIQPQKAPVPSAKPSHKSAPKPKQAFNNPFAALAALKKDLPK